MQAFELTISQAAEEIQLGMLSPVELTQSVLGRIACAEAKINAFTLICAESAMEQANRAEDEIARTGPKSPLHGIPFAVKDIFDVAGVPTTASSQVRDGSLASRDSAPVAALLEAGAVLVGKTELHEFAYGAITPNSRNPWDVERIPGGSSGGSAAAVAAGECLMALGTDTGGSIRIPASACGVVGLKPTYGRVSVHGVIPLSWSLDHVGPLTRTVRDAALSLNIIARVDVDVSSSLSGTAIDYTSGLDAGVKGLTIGVPSNYFFDDIDPEVSSATSTALELLESNGASLRWVEIPYSNYFMAALRGIMMPEASAYHEPALRAHPELYTDDVRLKLEAGALISASQYIKALRTRTLIQRALADAFKGLDVIVFPTLPITAPKVNEETILLRDGTRRPVGDAFVGHTALGNLTGLPAISVPCGFDTSNLPIGLQIIGRPYDERTILRVAQNYESSTDWRRYGPTFI